MKRLFTGLEIEARTWPGAAGSGGRNSRCFDTVSSAHNRRMSRATYSGGVARDDCSVINARIDDELSGSSALDEHCSDMYD